MVVRFHRGGVALRPPTRGTADRHHRNQDGPPGDEEHTDGDDEAQCPNETGYSQMTERGGHVGGRTEDVGIQIDAGQAGCHRIERLIDIMGDLCSIGIGEPFDDQHQ